MLAQVRHLDDPDVDMERLAARMRDHALASAVPPVETPPEWDACRRLGFWEIMVMSVDRPGLLENVAVRAADVRRRADRFGDPTESILADVFGLVAQSFGATSHNGHDGLKLRVP